MAEKSAGAEVAPKSTDLAKQREAELELLERAILDGEVLPFERDAEAISRSIMERVLAADSFESVFKPQEIPAWRDHLDEPVFVKDVHFNPSSLDGKSSVYAVVDILIISTGEVKTVTTGGQNVLVQLVQLIRHGWQDKPVKMTEKATSEGYQVLWLTAA